MEDEAGNALDVLVGQNIQRYRTAAGMSQTQLAEVVSKRAGYQISQQTVFKIEKGTRPLRYAEALHIAKTLGIPVDALAAVEDPATHRLGELLGASAGVRATLRAVTAAVAQYFRAAAALTQVVIDDSKKGATEDPVWLDQVEKTSIQLVSPGLIDQLSTAGRAASEALQMGAETGLPSDRPLLGEYLRRFRDRDANDGRSQ